MNENKKSTNNIVSNSYPVSITRKCIPLNKHNYQHKHKHYL